MKTSLVVLALAGLSLIATAAGQRPASAASEVPDSAYRIQVTVGDAAAGATAPVHRFSFTLRKGAQDRIETGDRLPVKASSDKYEYQNTGFTVTCRLDSTHDQPGQLSLDLILTITSVVPSSPGGTTLLPVLRNAQANISTVVPLGTATSVAEFKDTASTTTYNVRVLATPATP